MSNTHEFSRILEVLDAMKPLSPDAMLTSFDRLVAVITCWLRWVGVALFTVLLGFAAWVRFVGRLQGEWIAVALWVAIVSMLAAMASVVLDTVPSMVTLLRFKKNAHKRLLLEIDHDSKHVKKLMIFDKKLLERTDKWLAIKMERLRGQLGIFLGGADKIAIFALAGLAWSALKELPGIEPGWRHDLFVYGVAFVGGLAFGGVLLNVILRRYGYQRDLLALALDRKI